MWTDEAYEDDEPVVRSPYVDGAWGRTANPNTVDGELQNLAAFGDGLARLSGPQRTAAKVELKHGISVTGRSGLNSMSSPIDIPVIAIK